MSLLAVSCTKTGTTTGNLYTPTASDVTANATLTELQQGRTLYINNCGRCHGLPNPDDYTVTAWKSIIPAMAPNTSMTSAEVTLVTKYECRL
jgi:mono/diheme cytochrome c family protein